MGVIDYIRNQYYWMKQTDTDGFVKYLRKKGAEIGSNVQFYTSNVDMRYIDKISIGNNVTFSGVTLLAHGLLQLLLQTISFYIFCYSV